MDGSKVWDAYRSGKTDSIRNYCETDAANTYLLYLRFQLVRGAFSEEQYRRESELVRASLSKSHEPHWREFLSEWRAA
jgi:hypothetical protein